MSSFKIAPNALAVGNIASPSGSAATVSLNSAYTHLTAGAGFAMRLFARDLETITDFYVFAASFTGSKGNISMQARVYNEDPSSISRPGATLYATSNNTVLPAGTSGWIRFQFNFQGGGTPYTPSAVGEIIWIVVDNTSTQPTVDFPNIRTTTAVTYPSQSYRVCFTSTAGFSAAGTRQPRAAAFFVAGGRASGLPVTTATTPLATNTRARGFYFTPPNDVVIQAIELATAVGATMTGISIWESTQVPTDTPIYQFNTGQTGRASGELGGAIAFEPAFTARKGKSYYIMWTVSANSTTPTCTTIEDYAAYSSIIDTLYDDFTIFPLAHVNASNQFVIDRANQPRLQLLLGAINQPTIASVS